MQEYTFKYDNKHVGNIFRNGEFIEMSFIVGDIFIKKVLIVLLHV